MNEKSSNNTNLLKILLILTIFLIIIMGLFIYKLINEKTIIESNEIQDSINTNELFTITEININSRDYEIHQTNNDNNVLYDFKSKQWSNHSNGYYYLAVDNTRNLYIIDAAENIIANLDVKLEKLDFISYIDNDGKEVTYQINNYVTYARVSKLQNILEIKTGDDFITYIVNLSDFSTKLADIHDE